MSTVSTTTPGHARNRSGDFVVVANRLPVRATRSDRELLWHPSPGGLVSALIPVLHDRDAIWVGWPGSTDTASVPASHEGISLRGVPLSDADHEEFYLGFANATLWPLYHDAIRPSTFDRSWWQRYVAVNHRFAVSTSEVAAKGATIWIHDYQLQLVPTMLRSIRPDLRIGFFLHTPFPPQELFAQLPWRRQILEGLLGADLVGFQVPDAASNFARLARKISGATGTDRALHHDGRRSDVGAYPVSVDTAQLIQRAQDPVVQAQARALRRELGDPEFVMLGVDRLDYTKGIDHRIKAIGELFADGTLLAGRHVVVQVAVPSRETDPHYQREREGLEQLISEVNGEHARVGHPAIHYLHKSLPQRELISLYRAADAMLVTPLRDGMNLIAKEYAACRVDATGVLVLSEFAGAARELRAAILVNPHDLDGLKQAIRHALQLDPSEAKARMRRLRRVVRRRDVHTWAHNFLTALHQHAQSDRAAETSAA